MSSQNKRKYSHYQKTSKQGLSGSHKTDFRQENNITGNGYHASRDSHVRTVYRFISQFIPQGKRIIHPLEEICHENPRHDSQSLEISRFNEIFQKVEIKHDTQEYHQTKPGKIE